MCEAFLLLQSDFETRTNHGEHEGHRENSWEAWLGLFLANKIIEIIEVFYHRGTEGTEKRILLERAQKIFDY